MSSVQGFFFFFFPPSTYVMRRNSRRDKPNIVQVQPKCAANGEIPAVSVHLILKQHERRYSCVCVDTYWSSLLSLTIRRIVWIPTLLLVFPADWQLNIAPPPPPPTPGRCWGRVGCSPKRSHLPMCLIPLLFPGPTVIGNLYLVIQLLHFPSRLSRAPLGALHTVSESHE